MRFRVSNERNIKKAIEEALVKRLFTGIGFVKGDYFVRLDKEGRSFKSFSVYRLIGEYSIQKPTGQKKKERKGDV